MYIHGNNAFKIEYEPQPIVSKSKSKKKVAKKKIKAKIVFSVFLIASFIFAIGYQSALVSDYNSLLATREKELKTVIKEYDAAKKELDLAVHSGGIYSAASKLGMSATTSSQHIIVPNDDTGTELDNTFFHKAKGFFIYLYEGFIDYFFYKGI